MTTHPLDHMTALDAKGDSYWLDDLKTVDGTTYARVDVVSHSRTWIEVRDIGAREDVWISLRHVISFKLVEE